jgi:CubicO group peptidase (beta-lactamase class C family)
MSVALRLSLLCGAVFAPALAGQTPTAEQLEHAAALGAHHLCSGVFVVGRDYQRTPEVVLAQDLARFPAFLWQEDFAYEIDWDATAVTVSGEGIPARSARYHDDQGCTILPRGESDVFFTPVNVSSILPDHLTQPWPMGDLDATEPPPSGIDRAALDGALDWGMAQSDQNTRAVVVAYKGKIVGERYAPGFTKDTPQISWSMGKSITAALVGVLVHQGHFHWNDPAPVSEWRVSGDPRGAITIAHLLRMSSGLDFKNYGLSGPESYSSDNEHFLIYFDAPNVFRHAVNQPPAFAPDEEWRYKNSDPLTLGSIIRQTVEARGENYLTFPQRHLFDKIGARNYVLETDPYGNFIMTGYDFGSARDWARFGLLHLWDGVFEGERILPEGWMDFITTPAPADERRGYGGLWWLNRGGAMSRAPEDAYWAAGYMGQRTIVIPSRDMVIVRLGPSARGFNRYINTLVGDVLEAVER